MLTFLVQVSYTSNAWNALIRDPQNRLDIMRPIVANLGGKVESAFLAFGDYDVVAILQMPDNVSAAALSMAMMAGGGVKNVKTVALMTWNEGVEAMRMAKNAAYRPPKLDPMLDRT